MQSSEREVLAPAQPQVEVPVSDDECWRRLGRYRWLYDRLQLSIAQELRCGPCGLDPDWFPVIVKPIINLTGLSQGVRVHARPTNLDHLPGYFWCEVLDGPQYSVDLILERGRVHWLCATRCLEHAPGIFSGFHVGVVLPSSLRECIVGFIDEYLPKYVGVVNVEVRDGAILEVHLRPALQWLEFYGPDFLGSWAQLCDGAGWSDPGPVRVGWSVPVYDEWRRLESAEDMPLRRVYTGNDPWHPPGFYRTGYVNAQARDVAVLAARTLGTCYM